MTTALTPVFLSPRMPRLQRVNLTTERSTEPALAVDRKDDLESRAVFPPPARRPARTLVAVPASTPLSGVGAATLTPRPRWHEVCYRDPRKGARRTRMVKLVDARDLARRTAARIGGTVEIWAVFEAGHSELVEVLP